jgi:hypothetical protein
MTEGQIQDAVRLALNDERACWWRNNIGTAVLTGGARVRYGVGNPGGADLLGLFAGRFVAVEVKTPAGRLTEDQRRFQHLVERKGGVYAVCRGADDARALLVRLREERRQ